jgi:Bacterial extracellular solute-binding protein
MALTRRAFGLGLLGLGTVGTGGYLAVRDRPELQGLIGNKTKLFGFLGGEKQAFIEDPETIRALASYGLQLDARVAGSVEMVRQPELLKQKPQFLWPSSSVMVDLARKSGVTVRRDKVVLNAPIVVYTWQPVADGLQKSGLVTVTSGGFRELDLKSLLEAILAGTEWSKVGVESLYGRVRIDSTDPNRSNSGFMFSGLVLSLLASTVASVNDLAKHGDDALAIFRTMGLKSSSSGKLFDQYLAGGLGAEPMVVGYENQLLEWILADANRWSAIQARSAPKPVMLYPKPTVYSAHPLIIVDPDADRMLEAMLSPRLQEVAWTRHGFRGPLGQPASAAEGAVKGLLPREISSVLPMPDADVMLALLSKLAA